MHHNTRNNSYQVHCSISLVVRQFREYLDLYQNDETFQESKQFSITINDAKRYLFDAKLVVTSKLKKSDSK